MNCPKCNGEMLGLNGPPACPTCDRQSAAKRPSGAADCSASDTPETDALWARFNGLCLPRPHHAESKDQTAFRLSVERLEHERNERFTIEEISEYLAGWTIAPWNEIEKLGAKVARNALSQLKDEQDGIAACRERRLSRKS